MSHSYASLVIAPATLSYQTDWACVETTTPGVSFRRDETLAGYALYENITFTLTSVMFSRQHSEVFKNGVVPFLIVADSNPIDIKITKGRDREHLEDYRGSASVTFGSNTYHNDVTSGGQTNEKSFFRCPMPLTTTFIPGYPGGQPIQLSVNLINNVIAGNPGEPTIDSGTTVRLTVCNYIMGEKDSCKLMLAQGGPCLTRGKAISTPIGMVETGEKTKGNAGIYQSAAAEGPMNVRGAVGYVLPGITSSILAIYFDAVKCRLLFVNHGTIINSDIVDKVQAEGEESLDGSLVFKDDGGASLRVTARAEVMPGNLVAMEVSLRNVFYEPVPDLPGGGKGGGDGKLLTNH